MHSQISQSATKIVEKNQGRDLRLGIDAFVLVKQTGGIGRYLSEICQQLDRLLPRADFFLYSPRPLEMVLPSGRWHIRIGGARVAQLASSYVWLKLCVRKMAEADRVTLFWSPRTILPSQSSVFRTISTVHDLNYQIIPASMPPVTLWAHRLWFARDIRRTDAIITNSRATANRLGKIIGIEANAVARPGVAAVFKSQKSGHISSFLATIDICPPYFLAVGTLEPRKNLSALLEAFISLKRAGNLTGHCLIIAGNQGWGNRKLQPVLTESQAFGVRWLGFVSDEILAALYAGTTAFVYPSLYEGYGIPLLEARACGARVIASDLPELRESGGEGVHYIEPSVAGIQQGLLNAVLTPTPIPIPAEKITENWEIPAQVMVDIFRNLERM